MRQSRHLAFSLAISSLVAGCGSDPKLVDSVQGESTPEASVPELMPDVNVPGASGELLAQTPPMGFNDWNAFGCAVNETLIRDTADFFVSSGLKAAGYQYVNIDDCWSLMERDADGKLVPDPVKFPSGIKGVADYVHSQGLKLGIYGDAGTKTCAGYPGSLGTEDLDAQTWADWGVDYLKYDNCFNQSDGSREDFVRRYTAMQGALAKTGSPIVYSICEWGQSQPWEWATDVGQLWRTTGDITASWSSVRDIIASNAALGAYAGPGHWNDPDMLEIGNGSLSSIESRTHMSMWAMMAAPLIIGTDLRVASAETLSILGNPEIILIDQDPLGKQASVVSNAGGLMALGKPLQTGEYAVALYNSTDALALVSVPAADVGLGAAEAYHLRDVWSGATLEAKSVIEAGVPAHGAVVLRARPLEGADSVAPSLSIQGTLGSLIPGVMEAATLTTKVTNRGADAASQVTVSIQAPDGWSISAASAASAELPTDASLETTWGVLVPAGTSAGRYPITVTTTYVWGDAAEPASVASELVGAVAVPPADGTTELSTLFVVSSSNAVGPVEIDTSNGAELEGDGSLITIRGKVYTRGLGTSGPSSVVYYLGGRCSALTVDVGVDDAATTAGPASFEVYADGALVAESGAVTGADVAKTLTANVTGAALLELTTSGERTDWAAPRVTCGASTAPTTLEQTLFSFEAGTDGFTLSNAAAGGSVAPSTLFATDGASGLEVTSPADGNWFGQRLAAPLDLSAFSTLRYDVKTGAVGSPGEFALEVGDAPTWCQGGLWTWTNASSSKTITRAFSNITCPAGVTLDLTQVRGVWVFLKDSTVQIDNIRAE